MRSKTTKGRILPKVMSSALAIALVVTSLLSGAGTVTAKAAGADEQVAAFVERMYTEALGRASEPDGKADWTNQLLGHTSDGARLAEGFIRSAEFENRGLSDEDYLKTLYKTFFNREPDEGGYNNWLTLLKAGTPRETVLSGFVDSAEFANLCVSFGISQGYMSENGAVANPGIGLFVYRLYDALLGRTPDGGGLFDWTMKIATNQLSAAQVATESFILSQEFQQRQEGMTDSEYLDTLYATFFNRQADEGGKGYWLQQLSWGAKRTDIVYGFAGSQEFRNLQAGYGLEIKETPAYEEIVNEPQEDYAIDWKDANLEAAMRRITGITERDIMLSDVWKIRELDLEENNISDISALSSLTNLQTLWLYDNNISDINALSSLTNLTYLELGSNSISDISALSSLTNLQYLALDGNNISDISALSGLANLQELYLWENNISDISPLSGLTNLQKSHLNNNDISDISPLSGLTNLQELYLYENSISDISALSGLTNLLELWLSDNNISDISELSSLTNLQYLSLGTNNISNISVLSSLTNLQELELYENSISDISALSSLTNLQELDLGGNNISDISALSSLTNLQTLVLYANNISDISPLSGLTNLQYLYLWGNNINDISRLSSLTNLLGLYLGSNNISDISALSGLTNLQELYLDFSNISDISALSSLKNLQVLELSGNNISDYSPVSFVPDLRY